MKSNYLSIIILFLILFLTGCGNKEIETNMSEVVTDFEFTSQENQPFGLNKLEGEWWIASFLYTNCTMVCPITTTNMVDIQNEMQDAGIKMPIVSFTIDPDYDTPEVLKEYALEHGADLSHWTLLTGYDFKDIQKISNESFNAYLEDGGAGEMKFVHTTYFFLVNPDGEVVKKYDGISKEELQVLTDDIQILLN